MPNDAERTPGPGTDLDAFVDFMVRYEREIGPLVKRLRGDRTQAEFASLVGTSNVYLSMIENGKAMPTVKFLRRLQQALEK